MAPRGMKRGGFGGARAEIDRIDAALLKLLNRRAGIVAKIHRRKARRGEAVFDPARTDAILDRLLRLNKGPLRDAQVLALFTFLLHHYALGHRPGRPPEPPLFLAQAAPGADQGLLRRHGIRVLRPGASRKGLVDARDLGKVPLDGARGVLFRIRDKEDEEAVTALCYRATLLWLALAGGGR